MIDKVTKARLEAMNRANAAKTWFAMGYTPMPVLPGQSRPNRPVRRRIIWLQ